MKISFKSILGIIFGVSAFMFYVSNVRPVGWFDSSSGDIARNNSFYSYKEI